MLNDERMFWAMIVICLMTTPYAFHVLFFIR